MECSHPIRLKREDYVGGLSPGELVVPCGKCPACLANRRAEWCIRLKSELLNSDFGLFVTLTSDDEHIKYVDVVDNETGEYLGCKTAPDKVLIQKFLKRLRKRLIPKGSDKVLRYFLISEYGDHTQRAHYHGLFFFKNIEKDKTLYDSFTESWQQGFIKFGDISDASIAYCTKYALKKTAFPLGIKDTFMLCSKKPALGGDVILHQIDIDNIQKENFTRIFIRGESARLPRLFRDKMINKMTKDFDEDDKTAFKVEISRRMLQRSTPLLDWLRKNPGKTAYDYFYEKQRNLCVRDELILQRTSKQNLF